MAVLLDFASSLLLCISNSLYMNRVLYCILMYKKTTIEHVSRVLKLCFYIFLDKQVLAKLKIYEPRREKTGFLHMRKQRRRSALR